MTRIDVDLYLPAIDAATKRLVASAESLDDTAVADPSQLPGWDRAMVLTHVARNVDGFCRMLAGARRGEITHMYPNGRQGRQADIEAGRGRPAAEATADVEAAATRLAATCSAMAPDDWLAQGEMLVGRVTVAHILVSRLREVEVHHSDLGLAYGPAQWPAAFVGSELQLAVNGLAERLETGAALRLVDPAGGEWHAGPHDAPGTVVSAPAAELLAWLLGRPSAVPDPPEIGPWR